MAPRGRRGETRIDAALDALVPMGFSKANIRKAVRELLKVYGGTDGWVFIEEASYKLLIEALLGVEDESEPGPPLLMNEAVTEDNMLGDAGSSSAAGAGSSRAAEAPLSKVPPLMDAEKTCANCGSHQDSAVTDDFSFPQHDFQSQTKHNPTAVTMTASPPPRPPIEPQYIPLPPPPPPPPPAAARPTIPRTTNISSPKRKPCYGWWGDENDPDDFICLPLMPVRPRKFAEQQRNRRA